MNNKLIFSFVGGLIAGGGIGFVAASKFLDKKYFAKYDERAKELEAYYDKTGIYDRDWDNDISADMDDEEVNDRENGPLSRDQRKVIKDKLLQNEKQTTNYAAMYKSKAGPMAEALEEKLAGEESPEEDDPEEDDDSERAFDEHQKNKNRPPRIISSEAMEELGPEWDQQTLMFYMYDAVLTTEDDDVVEDEPLLVGDCLYKYGFSDNDEMVIYVQNFALTTVYEIQKVMASFH